MRYLITLLAFSICAAACKPAAESRTKDPTANWKVVALPFMTVRIPPDWESDSVVGKYDTDNLVVGPVKDWGPPLGKVGPNAGLFVRYTKQNPPSDPVEVVQQAEQQLKSSDRIPGRFLGRPQTVRLGAGKCIAYRLERRLSNCENISGISKKRNACYTRFLKASCTDREGTYYDFQAELGHYIEPGKPTAEVVERGNQIEQVLASVKFTQG